MFDSGDCRVSHPLVALFRVPLRATWMDEIPEIFRKCCLCRRIFGNDTEFFGHVMYSGRSHHSKSSDLRCFFNFARWMASVISAIGFCCSAQSSNASITDPARTVAAFHSPFDSAL
jgi:hypothetical protein